MIGFASPAWLLGLLLVPVIWYVHRSGPILRRHAVSSLDLWRASGSAATQAGARRQSDPAWIRRALCAAALSIALAAPQLPRPTELVTLWVDDSLSMRTIEAGESRLQRGLAQVAAALGNAAGGPSVEVRSLSNPWVSLAGLDAANSRSLVSHAGTREPRLPDPASLDRSRSNWLLTDGADAKVDAWAAEAPLARVFQVAQAAGNLGIASLSARPQPGDAGDLAVQVRLVNGGSTQERRRIEIAADGKTLATREVTAEPGSTVTLEFDARLPAVTLSARLAPTDSLPDDDAASVQVSALEPVSVVLAAGCPTALVKAVRAHPALKIVDDAQAGLAFDCGGAGKVADTAPRVRLVDGARAPLDAKDLLWSRAVSTGSRPIPGEWPSSTLGRLDAPRPSDRVLLEADERPLIIVRAGTPPVVETSLDLSSQEFAASESLPLLVGLLADSALDESLLSRSVTAGRGDDASRIASLRTLRASAGPGPRSAVHRPAFRVPLLLLALALLAWDAFALARRLARDRLRSTASTP